MCKEALVWDLSRFVNILPLLGVIATQGMNNTPGPVILITPWMNNGSLKVYLSDNPDVDKIEMVRDPVKGMSIVTDASVGQRRTRWASLSSPLENATSCPR